MDRDEVRRPHQFRDNFGRPEFRLPYRDGNDTPYSLPLSPKNVNVTSPYLIGVIDIRWDSPASYAAHNSWEVQGVNIYKSYDTPEGPYKKINDTPVGALYYRDQTKEVYVVDEDPLAGGRFIAGTNATNDWIIKTFHKPLVIPGTNGEIATTRDHVTVKVKETAIDDFIEVPPFKVFGETGEIYLINRKIYNHTTNTLDDPILPNITAGGEVRVSYTHIDNHIQTNINRKIYYKVTTVAIDPDDGNTKETPLNECEAYNLYDMEKIDWIWAEAIRRNRWMLEQAGERVNLFIRKWAGQRCHCWDEQYRTSKSDCSICYGTGYVGGYEGPYPIIVAPPETEKMVQLMDMGLRVSYDWNTWTGPYPLLNDRDIVVRQNNDRFMVSRVNPQGSRGAIYQQHFSLEHLNQSDPVYQVGIPGGSANVPAEWNAYREDRPTDASPTIPNKPEIPDQYEYRGRTVCFENIVY